jgi:N6-adenosine-specific RNA methylase IME4
MNVLELSGFVTDVLLNWRKVAGWGEKRQMGAGNWMMMIGE